MRFTNYIWMVLGVALTLLTLITAINYTINPLGIYGTPIIKDFNDQYPTVPAFLRIHKAERLKQVQPDTVITGSSRALIGLDPRPEIFGDEMRIYNMGLTAAFIYEQLCMLEFAAAIHPLKRIIITLDFFAFYAGAGNPQFDPARCDPLSLSFPRNFYNRYNTAISLDTFIAATKHLRYIKRPEKQSFIQLNGRMQNNSLYHRIRQNGAAPYFKNPPVPDGKKFTFSYTTDPHDTTFKHFSAMLDLARQRNIETVILFSPIHESLIAGLEDEGLWDKVEEWKSRIIAITRANALHYNAAAYPLWDFANRNRFTTENVPADGDKETRMHYFTDSSHYTPEVGDIVLKKVLGLYSANDPYPAFGIRLIPAEK